MSCHLYSSPSEQLIECLDSILPSLTDLFNSSPTSGIFQHCFKSALVTLTVKKSCLDHNDLHNHRPVSNLFVIAKILGRLALSQVSSCVNSHNHYNVFQSSYRPGYSTETAVLKVVNDLFLSFDKIYMSCTSLYYLMTTRQNSCLSSQKELSISITYVLQSLLVMFKFFSNSRIV